MRNATLSPSGKIDDGADVAAVAAVIHALARRLGRAREAAEHRRSGDELQKTAFAVGAVQGALRPAQYLDALQIPGVEVAGDRSEPLSRALLEPNGDSSIYTATVEPTPPAFWPRKVRRVIAGLGTLAATGPGTMAA